MEPFKNNISPQLVSCIAGHLEQNLKSFDRERFESVILAELEGLELKARSQLITDQLHHVLPKNIKARYKLIRKILHPLGHSSGVSDDGMQSNDKGIRGWGMMPLGAVVGQHGLKDFDLSLSMLKEMTNRFSSEFDVRYFLLEDQDRALRIMSEWVDDSNYHVRRLVSEGARPRLPWAMQLPQLIADPSPVLPLLEALIDDQEEYVRRSVANHLNDISKDHPKLVAQITKKWMLGADKNRKRLLRHACRTLIKEGYPPVLSAFGYRQADINVPRLMINKKKVKFGDGIHFTLKIKSKSNKKQALIIDYLIHFKKNNGKLAAKVFKWKTLTLEPNAELTIEREHAIRPITTRKYYAGQQGLSVRINGQDYESESFELIF